MSNKVYTQIPPPPTPQSAEDAHPQLSASEQEKYQEVLDYISNDTYTLPDVERDAQLSEEEKFWLSRECILRYLLRVSLQQARSNEQPAGIYARQSGKLKQPSSGLRARSNGAGVSVSTIY